MSNRLTINSIFVTGAKGNFKIPYSFIEKSLRGLLATEKDVIGLDPYIITGYSRTIEQRIVAISKELKVRSLVVPANFQMYSGNSAEQMRNADVLHTFKPSMVIIFADEKTIESDSVLEYLKKITIKAAIPLKILTNKKGK